MKQFVILGHSEVDGMRVTEHVTLSARGFRGRVSHEITIDGVRSTLFTERGPERLTYADAMDDARKLFRDRMRTVGSTDMEIDAWLGNEVAG